jgi:Ca2+/Na+ antiporter
MGVENGSTWSAYTGTAALILAAVLLVIGCALAYLGTRLDHPLKARRPGKALGVSLVLIWVLAVASLLISVGVYGLAMYKQVGHVVTLPPDRIAPITALSGLVSFIVIAVLARRQGLKVAIGSAIVGTIAAPMIFELPFDLIVMTRTYPPTPEVLFMLLFFLPLFLVEIISFMMLTLSPLTSLSRYTLYSLAAMLLVFAFWALFGFSYPSSALPFASNAVSKVLAFVTAITLFLPQARATTDGNE